MVRKVKEAPLLLWFWGGGGGGGLINPGRARSRVIAEFWVAIFYFLCMSV